MTDSPETGTVPASPTPEAPDAELVEFLGGEVESEAPAPESKAPADAEQPETSDADQPRDQQGRYTKAEADAAALETPTTETPPPPPEPAPTKPFSYRAYGAEHSPLAGAVETSEGGVHVPPDAVPALRQILAEGHNAESRRRHAEREREQKLTSARSARAELVDQATLTLQRLAELRRNPEYFDQWRQDLDRNWAILEAEVERDTLRQRLTTQQQQAEQQAIERQAEAMRPYMRQTLEQNVAQMIANEPELKHLNSADTSERLWSAFFDRVFLEAQQDDPNGRYRKGEILVDHDAIRAELQYEAKLRRVPTPAVTTAAGAKPPEPKQPVAPPPVVSTKGQGARPAPKIPKFKSTEEADSWFESGGYHELG